MPAASAGTWGTSHHPVAITTSPACHAVSCVRTVKPSVARSSDHTSLSSRTGASKESA